MYECILVHGRIVSTELTVKLHMPNTVFTHIWWETYHCGNHYDKINIFRNMQLNAILVIHFEKFYSTLISK